MNIILMQGFGKVGIIILFVLNIQTIHIAFQ